jgi:hypothetical protein
MHLTVFLAGAMVLATTAFPLQAQDEARLRKAFEGKRITLKMDMPATSEGVDVHPGSSRSVDYDKVGKRMKKHGLALRDGEPARITRVKVKADLIEIQLNGGGYGTFGDGLGSLVKNKGADSGVAQQMKYQNQRGEKLAGGSRFNLRYPNGVGADDMTPAAIIQALEEYATFPEGIATMAAPVSHSSGESASSGLMSAAQVRKGMSSDDVAGVTGTPTSSKSNGPITTNRYHGANGSIDVDFFNDVVVDVRQVGANRSGSLRKGMSMEEVGQLAGKPISSSAKNQLLTNKYHWQDGILEADFYNGVLVGYRTSSK